MKDLIELFASMSGPSNESKPTLLRRSRLSILSSRLDKAHRLHRQELENGNLHKSAQAVYIIRNIGDELSTLTTFRSVS